MPPTLGELCVQALANLEPGKDDETPAQFNTRRLNAIFDVMFQYIRDNPSVIGL